MSLSDEQLDAIEAAHVGVWVTTHFEGCFVEHRDCATALLLAEVQALRAAFAEVRDIHADTGQVGASCAEGCGGRWPCATYCEANAALGEDV